MVQGTLSAFEYLVKQLEYEVRTGEEVLRLKDEGKTFDEISEIVGITPTEVRSIRPIRVERLKEQFESYQKRLKGGRK
ncbi:hypothetical protein ACWM35_01350 [Neobacillus sp. K501]